MKAYHDISGDGGSNILGQVMALKDRLEARLSRIGHVVAVMSGKDGVGKSTVTAGLPFALTHPDTPAAQALAALTMTVEGALRS